MMHPASVQGLSRFSIAKSLLAKGCCAAGVEI